MRPRPKEYAKGKLEYLSTVRGNSNNAKSLETLMIWFKETDIKPHAQDNNILSLHYIKAHWTIKNETTVEFDLYNTAVYHRFNKIIPHRTDTNKHRQDMGVFLYVLIMSGYNVDMYRNKELTDIKFTRQLDWQI